MMQPQSEASPQGTHVSTEQLFRAHASFVARFLTRLGVPSESLDDAVQEVFLVVHRRGGYVAGPAKPTSYLANIAVNTASAQRRQARKRRDRRSEQELDGLAGRSDPAQELERRQDMLRLDRALDRLEPSLRATLLMADAEGESCVAIANATAVPLGTVYWRLDRARKKFREALFKVDVSRGRRTAAGAALLIPDDAMELLRSGWSARDSEYELARGLGELRNRIATYNPVTSLWVGKLALGASGLVGLAVVAVMQAAPGPRLEHARATDRVQTVQVRAESLLINTQPVDTQAVTPKPASSREPAIAREPAVRERASALPRRHARRLATRGAAISAAPDSVAPDSVAPTEPRAPARPITSSAEQPSEAALLARAERLLASNPSEALAAVRAIDPRTSYLHEERDYIELMALWANGEHKTGRSLARAFLQRYPSSAFARLVKTTTGIE